MSEANPNALIELYCLRCKQTVCIVAGINNPDAETIKDLCDWIIRDNFAEYYKHTGDNHSLQFFTVRIVI